MCDLYLCEHWLTVVNISDKRTRQIVTRLHYLFSQHGSGGWKRQSLFNSNYFVCVRSSTQAAVRLNDVTLCDKADRLEAIVNSCAVLSQTLGWIHILFWWPYISFCSGLHLKYPVAEMNVLRHFITDSSPTFYVVVLHKRFFWQRKCRSNSNQIRCSDAAAQFIHDQLSGDWSKGGGGLIVQRQLPT